MQEQAASGRSEVNTVASKLDAVNDGPVHSLCKIHAAIASLRLTIPINDIHNVQHVVLQGHSGKRLRHYLPQCRLCLGLRRCEAYDDKCGAGITLENDMLAMLRS